MAKPSQPAEWCCGAFVLLAVFTLQYDYILNSFYSLGAPYFDSGLFAHILWHNNWQIDNPHTYGDFSYLVTHFSPVLMLVNQLSYFIPFPMVEFFAAFMASIYTLLAFAMYYTLIKCVRPQGLTITTGLALLALGFAFSGLIMQGVWLPHFEYAIPAGILLFLIHYKLGHKYWAMFFLIFTLLLREDAGFHFTAVIALLAGGDYLRTRSFTSTKKEAGLVLIASGYSIFALWMTFHLHSVYGLQGSVFRGIYTGTPPYAHLSFSLLGDRLQVILKERAYLWLSFLLSVGWAFYKRNFYWAIGFIAYIPWFIFNLTAYNENTGWLYAYYVFPFVIGLAWPFVTILWIYGKIIPRQAVREALVLQVMLVLAGLTTWNIYDHHIDFSPTFFWSQWGGLRLQPSVENREIVREFITKVKYNPSLGVTMGDNGIQSLVIGSVEQNRGTNQLLTLSETRAIDSLIYFKYQEQDPEVIPLIRKNNLTSGYNVMGTSIYLFTNRSPVQLGAFASLLTAVPPDSLK